MPSLTLTRLTGFDRNKKTTVDKASIVLGTDAAADLRFDPTWDKTVSPQHVTLEFKTDAWWAKDSSKDGTYVGSRKIGWEKLQPGTVLELGRGGPKVQVDFAAAAASPAPATARPAAAAAAAPTAQSAVPPPVAAPAPASVAPPAPARSATPRWVVPVAVVAAIALAAVAWMFRGKGGSDGSTDEAFARIAKDYAQAVGVVTVIQQSGAPEPMATAWAVAPRVFATNSHVTQPVSEILASGGSVYIVINRTTDKRLKVTKAVVHPRYGKSELNFEGKEPAIGAYDVGLLHVDEPAPLHFQLAPRAELEKVEAGYRIGYMGFPMENMAGGGVEVRNPVAILQTGIVLAISDFWLGTAAYEKRFLIRHNLGTAGGSSGSGVFNERGQIVGIHSAGSYKFVKNEQTGDYDRIGSSAMVNYAQRIDLLRDIWPDYPRD